LWLGWLLSIWRSEVVELLLVFNSLFFDSLLKEKNAKKNSYGLASNLVHLVGKITNLKRLREHLRFGLLIGRVEVKFFFFGLVEQYVMMSSK
jgi:hypothetical protein